MKVLLIHRAMVNGGDYLITENAKDFLLRELRGIQLDIAHFNELNAMPLDTLNSYSHVILAGGPLYDNRFLAAENFRLLRDIESITAKICFWGTGWYGQYGDTQEIKAYRFDESIVRGLQLVAERGGFLGCRDYITKQVLDSHGIPGTVLTGCAVWYRGSYEGMDLSPHVDKKVKKLAISDPGITKDKAVHNDKFQSVKQTISILRRHYPDAKFLYTFNGGINTKYSTDFNLRVVDFLRQENIAFYDISGTSDKFSIYDDIDLHVGYRVHTHLYALSARIPSVLIEEDARGKGMNMTLGLRSIHALMRNGESFITNPYFQDELNQYILDLKQAEYDPIKLAFLCIDDTRNRVRQLFKSLA